MPRGDLEEQVDEVPDGLGTCPGGQKEVRAARPPNTAWTDPEGSQESQPA